MPPKKRTSNGSPSHRGRSGGKRQKTLTARATHSGSMPNILGDPEESQMTAPTVSVTRRGQKGSSKARQPQTGCLPQGTLGGAGPHQSKASRARPPQTDSVSQGTPGDTGAEQQSLATIMATMTAMQDTMLAQQRQLDAVNTRLTHRDTAAVLTAAAVGDTEDSDDSQDGESIHTVSTDSDGESDSLGAVSSERSLITAGMPLGSTVERKIQQDIFDDKFVELGSLLTRQEGRTQQSDYDMVFLPEKGKFKVNKNVKHVSDIKDWAQAFDIFISIAGSRKPSWVSDLFTYKYEVLGLADAGLDWLYYDRHYRMERAAAKAAGQSPPGWDTLNQQLYNHVLKQGKVSHFRGKSDEPVKTASDTPRYSIPKSYCFAFHSTGRRCTKYRCGYDHTCYQCKRSAHPAYMCRGGQSGSTYNGQNRQNYSRPSSGAFNNRPPGQYQNRNNTYYR